MCIFKQAPEVTLKQVVPWLHIPPERGRFELQLSGDREGYWGTRGGGRAAAEDSP